MESIPKQSVCTKCKSNDTDPGRKWCSPCFKAHEIKQIIEFVEDASSMRELSKTYIDGLTSVPSTLRHEVWKKYISYTYRKGKCFCCKTGFIEDSNFECGHIISKCNGGPILLKNLRPICGQCNKSMGVRNMDEFIILCGFWSTLIKKRLDNMTDEELFLIDSKFTHKIFQEPLSEKAESVKQNEPSIPVPDVIPNAQTHVHIHIESDSKPQLMKERVAPAPKRQITRINLDGYKVSGLKDLCRQYNVSTSNCSVREDYVAALKKKGIGK